MYDELIWLEMCGSEAGTSFGAFNSRDLLNKSVLLESRPEKRQTHTFCKFRFGEMHIIDGGEAYDCQSVQAIVGIFGQRLRS